MKNKALYQNKIAFLGVRLLYRVAFLLLFFTGCNPSDLEKVDFPEALTVGFSVIELNTVELTGEVKGLASGNTVDQYGHYWSVNPIVGASYEEILSNGPEVQRVNTNNKITNGPFTTKLSGLTPGETYYFRAYVIQGEEEYIASEKNFSLEELSGIQMDVKVEEIDSQNRTAKVTSSYSNLPAGLEIKAYGMAWALHTNPDIESDPFLAYTSTTILSINDEIIDTSVINPAGGENYIRPFIVVGAKAYYGTEISFVVGNFWTRKEDFPGGPTKTATSFVIGNKGYVMMGKTGPGNFWEFDPNGGEIDPVTGTYKGKWTERAFFPGPARAEPVSFAIEASPGKWKGYAGTGGYNNDFWEYDPAENRWYRKKNYPREVHFAVGFAIGGKGYVGAGLIAQEINTPCADYPVSPNFHEFDPNAGPIDNETGVPEGTWTQKASTPQGESDHPPSCRVSSRAVGFALEISPGNWKGYIAGGADSNLYEFDPDAGNIDPQTGLPTGEWKGWASTGVVWPTPENLRESMTVFTIGNSAYLGLGRSDTNGDLLAEFWKLEPGEDYRWTRLADFGGTPRELATGFAIGKKGYAGTGQNFQDLADFWEYTPEEN